MFKRFVVLLLFISIILPSFSIPAIAADDNMTESADKLYKLVQHNN